MWSGISEQCYISFFWCPVMWSCFLRRLSRYKSSLVKYLFTSCALFFFFGWFVFLILSVMSYLYFLDISLEICIVNTVSLYVMVFWRAKLLILIKIRFIDISFYDSCFLCHIYEVFAYPKVTKISCLLFKLFIPIMGNCFRFSFSLWNRLHFLLVIAYVIDFCIVPMSGGWIKSLE